MLHAGLLQAVRHLGGAMPSSELCFSNEREAGVGTVALLDTPAAQCTRTFPRACSPSWMKAMAFGKCSSSPESSVSHTGITIRALQLAWGLYSAVLSAITVKTCVKGRDRSAPTPPMYKPASDPFHNKL